MSRPKRFALVLLACVCALSQVMAFADDVNALRQAGTRVFAYWQENGYWYPATVLNETEQGIEIRYDDDGSERTLPPGQVVDIALDVGSVVEGNWLGGGVYYEGLIGAINGENITINYADGDVEQTTLNMVRIEAYYVEGYVLGQLVFARWSDGYWYPGQVTGINGDNFDIRFDDGRTATVDRKGISYNSVAEGNRVEGNWLGGGTYYPGTIAYRGGNLIYIVYDDGDEEETTIARIRLAGPPGPRP